MKGLSDDDWSKSMVSPRSMGFGDGWFEFCDGRSCERMATRIVASTPVSEYVYANGILLTLVALSNGGFHAHSVPAWFPYSVRILGSHGRVNRLE